MSQEACNTYLKSLDENGVLVIDEDLVQDPDIPDTVSLFRVPATRLAEEMGFPVVANIVMLGFLTGVTGVVSLESVSKAVESSVPRGTVETNLIALERGLEYAQRAMEA